MDHLEDKLGEMLSQVAKDLVKVRAGLQLEDYEEQPTPDEQRIGSSDSGGAHGMMTGMQYFRTTPSAPFIRKFLTIESKTESKTGNMFADALF